MFYFLEWVSNLQPVTFTVTHMPQLDFLINIYGSLITITKTKLLSFNVLMMLVFLLLTSFHIYKAYAGKTLSKDTLFSAQIQDITYMLRN